MKLLVVSATRAEIEPFIREFLPAEPSGREVRQAQVQVLITGVGMPATIYHLTRELQRNSYDMVINAGIAGSFDRGQPLGAVLQVRSDGFADLGAEDSAGFLDIFQMGLAGPDTPPFQGGRLLNPSQEPGLPVAAGITVNTVHGNPRSIEAAYSRWAEFSANSVHTGDEPVRENDLSAGTDASAEPIPLVESMEGAAFFYVCINEGMRCLQLRAVSNYVEKRNRENWNIPLAVKNLNAALLQLTKKYQ